MSRQVATELPAGTPGCVEFMLGGVMGNGTLCLYDGRAGGSFIMGATDAVRAVAKRWKTRAGVERFIAKETAAGSNWTYTILMVDQA